MNKVSKLFDRRSKKYTQIYDEPNAKRLLHQEKRVRAEIVQKFVITYLSSRKEEKEARVVDIGCGMGNVLLNLKKSGLNANMFGLDISAEMIGLANEKAHSADYKNIDFSIGSTKNFKLKADIVLSLGVIGYQKDQEKFLIELSNIVDQEGYLIFTTANGDSLLRNARRYISKFHSFVFRKTKSEGLEFKSMKDKQVELSLKKNGFKLEENVYITFGLGLFASSIECSIDKLLLRYLSNSFIGKYLSLTVIYVYKRVT